MYQFMDYYDEKANTSFHANKMSHEGIHYICLLVTLKDPIMMGKNYYPQAFLEEFRYIVKQNKIE